MARATPTLVTRLATTPIKGRNPDVGPTDLRTLGMIEDHRGLSETILGRGVAFGVYADVLRPGRVRLADVLERGD